MPDFAEDIRAAHPDFEFPLLDDAVTRAQAALLEVSRVRDVSPLAKLPFKTRTVIQSALRRNCELRDSFVLAFNQKLYAPLFILARASIETGALAWDVWRGTESLVDLDETSGLVEFDARVVSILLGSRTGSGAGDPDEYRAPNVLTIIDRLSKGDVPRLRDTYNELSEYAHPNYAGLLEAYTTSDPLNRQVIFDDTPFELLPELVGAALHSLGVGLGLTVLAMENYESRMTDFAVLCERGLFEDGTWPESLPYPVNR